MSTKQTKYFWDLGPLSVHVYWDVIAANGWRDRGPLFVDICWDLWRWRNRRDAELKALDASRDCGALKERSCPE